ncbi:iron ABC transporter permease, partial [Staphylococcus aureus]
MIMIIINLKGEKFVMKYLLKGNILLLLLILLTIISLFIGVSELSIKDLLHLTESQRNILFSSRIP